MPAFVDTVAWVHLENGKILCARPRGKDIFYVPGGKREGAETDLQTLLREIAEELTVALLPETMTHVGTYEVAEPPQLAQGHPELADEHAVQESERVRLRASVGRKDLDAVGVAGDGRRVAVP
jgi:8-oxo-dGTP pyrophosphatase MutT (NUDIX family)